MGFKINRVKEKLPDAICLGKISSTLRRLAIAASGNLGGDCMLHAAITSNVLSRLGIKSSINVGFAAWRVGDGDSDVILHAPVSNLPNQPGAIPYHVWLTVGSYYLDMTTYQLRIKAKQLDSLDGGVTNVAWCPDYLFFAPKDVCPIETVINEKAGLYNYTRVSTLEKQILARCEPLDQQDADLAWKLYENPCLQVFGPNDVTRSCLGDLYAR